MNEVAHWLLAFGLTLAIELAVVVPMLREAEPDLGRRLAFGFYANLATHPAVWFIIPKFGLALVPSVAIAEVWALVLEGFFYSLVLPKLGLQRAMMISIVANAASFTIGMALRVFHLV